MYKIDHGWYDEKAKCLWTLKGCLAWLMREKKTSMHYGTLIMSFKSIIDITKEVPSLESSIASIMFNNLFRMENYIFWACEWNLRSEESNDS